MPLYEAVLFDFDGVLADTEPLHYTCWSESVQDLGIQLDWPTYQKYCIGLHDGQLVEFIRHLAHPPAPFGDVWAKYPRKMNLFLQKVTTAPPFPAPVLDLIKSLSDYKLAVVTSSGRCEVEPVLDAGGIRSLFDAVVCAEDVSRHKPAPDPYLLAAEMLGVSSALVVEDSDVGVQSARAAGFNVLRVAGPSETAALVPKALG